MRREERYTNPLGSPCLYGLVVIQELGISSSKKNDQAVHQLALRPDQGTRRGKPERWLESVWCFVQRPCGGQRAVKYDQQQEYRGFLELNLDREMPGSRTRDRVTSSYGKAEFGIDQVEACK